MISMRRIVFLLILLALLCLGGAVYWLNHLGITPRSLGPYIERRASGHNAAIEFIGRQANTWLLALDRGRHDLPARDWHGVAGVQPVAPAAPAPAARQVAVADSAGMVRAIATALPGDSILLLPGHYRVDRVVPAHRPGAPEAPIVVRAERPGSVRIDIDANEGFRVSAPFWRFENLSVYGACHKGSRCEHAFHVVGNAHHFTAINNLIVDFDAHFKVNAEKGRYPDHGEIISNTLRNDSVRKSTRPVTPIDLVTVNHWVIRQNLITDFIKAGGDRISYGAFAKGGGADNLFEQNIVICEHRLRGAPGQRIGLSLGGGGTGKAYCRDGKCITEQTGGILRANLVASCSDDGIYLNAAARSSLLHNTLVDTGGITVRFPESSATIDGNLVDGIIRSRDGGLLRLGDNRFGSAASLYLGRHPVRALFREPQAFDFRWRDAPAERGGQAAAVPDLCGAPRPAQPRLGAFEDFDACLARPSGQSDRGDVSSVTGGVEKPA